MADILGLRDFISETSKTVSGYDSNIVVRFWSLCYRYRKSATPTPHPKKLLPPIPHAKTWDLLTSDPALSSKLLEML